MPRIHRGRIRRPVAVAVAGFLLVVVGLAPALPARSLARFVDSATSSATIATDTLAPPTGLAATGGTSVALTWTPTVDAYATGYSVLRGTTSGGPYSAVGAVTPGSATTTTDGPAPGTWYYVLRSVFQSWSSPDSDEASATVGSPTTTAVQSCTTTAADTTGAGDNDGYEVDPARVCVDDGSAATDSDTGTSSSASCGSGATPSTTKDRHRFWGYAFGLPTTVGAISGITVRADLGMNNNGGTTNLCVQLSWDGGTTWTAIKSLEASGLIQSAYTFGSAADTWGRSWTPEELDAARFQVRVIDATTQSNKQFRLDYLGVSVSYFP